MSILTKAEIDKLSIMYEGDKSRDAADKIRGFLFQDFVTIKCLLQNQVQYVCSEYLEDVDVFFEDGTFEFIQVKYYPKTSTKMKEISTDLYYQYLRLQMLKSELKAIPVLYIHRQPKVEKPTLEQMKIYINQGDNLSQFEEYSDMATLTTWLKKTVYSETKKEDQKKKLFAKMASEESLKEFLTKFKIVHQYDIDQYKEEVMEVLSGTYPNPDEYGDEEHWQCILLGLAISYIQRRYMSVASAFEDLRVKKEEFDQYMKECTQTKTEQTIIGYLTGIICEKYEEIINCNELSSLQENMLSMICQNTVHRISEIGETVAGQYQLLNTYSMDDARKIAGYRNASLDNRLRYIAECKQNFLTFLEYLWKIMLNICQEKVKSEREISTHLDLFNPVKYIDCSVTEYVCLNFPKDKYATHSVILPRVGGNFNSVERKIVGRMVKLSPKPEKWFFENSKIEKGKNYYDYSTANVNKNATIADLGENSFYIECMDCIGVDEGEWGKQETCDDCIFSEKCINEGK